MFIFSNVSGYGIELFEKEAKNHLGVMQIVTGGVEQNDSMATKKKKSEYIWEVEARGRVCMSW